MSSDASAPAAAAVAAPISVDSANSVAAPAHDSSFGASILGKSDAAALSDAAVEQQQPAAEPQAEAEAAPAVESSETSEQDAAAVAAAAAAAAAADASSAAQTITELATAATNAANNASVEAPTSVSEQPAAEATATEQPAEAVTTQDAPAGEASDAADKPEAGTENNGEAEASAEQQDGGAASATATAGGAEESTSGLPRNVESELRDIYAVASAIANFSVAHVNQVNIPTPQKVRTIIQKALKLTSSLSMLLAQPEVALRQLDSDDHGKRPAESKLDSARKRQRSSDWDGSKGALGTSGLPMAPYTPTAGLRVFPDGSLPTSFPSPGFDGESKGPQYKKRSRAPAPGSCQACGTGETPEWRRGPDGARTLCNACGLHYAKLVRKRMQQEGGEEPSPSHAPPQVSLVSLEELRASTKSAEAAAAAGLSSSASSSSLNGTPIKGLKHEAWNTPSKPPRVPSSLSSSVLAPNLDDGTDKTNDEIAPPPPAPQTAGIVEPAPTPVGTETQQQQQQHEQQQEQTAPEPVIAPELSGEPVAAVSEAEANGDERPMETDQ